MTPVAEIEQPEEFFAEEQPAPAETPAGSGTRDAAAAATTPEDDLFGAPSAADSSDDPPAKEDDLFGEPANDSDGGLDDLFGDPPNNDSSEEQDPFGQLQSPGGLNSNQLRLWTDNSGLYRTMGRLESIGEQSVRLVTANGSVVTTPINRLSSLDLDFVFGQAELQRAEQITRTASR